MRLPARIPSDHSAVVAHEVNLPAAVPYVAPPGQDFSDLLRKLWRRKGVVVATALAATLLAAIAAAGIEPRYTASAQVLIGVPEARVSSIEAVLAGISADAETVQNEAYILQSRAIAEQVVDGLGLEQDPEFNPKLRPQPGWLAALSPGRWVSKLSNWLTDGSRQAPSLSDVDRAERDRQRVVSVLLSKVTVTPLGRSHVLSVEVESENPRRAAEVANGLSEAYVGQQLTQQSEATELANTWLDDQIAKLRQSVEVTENAVERYRQETGIYQSTVDSNVTTQQLTELNTQLIMAETAKAEAQARLSQAQSLLKSPDLTATAPEVIHSPLIQALKQQLAEIERAAAELASAYGEKHPKLLNARAQVTDMQNKIRAEIGRIIDGLQNETSVAVARYEALRANFERLKTEMGETNQGSIRLNALMREADANRELLQTLLIRSKETSAQEDIQQADARMISAAVAPERPSFPPTPLLLLLSVLGGGILGVLLALLVEHLDRTFRSAEDVEELTGLPALALVPTIRGGDAPPSHVLRNPASAYAEALRKLHAALLFSDPVDAPKVVMFASAAPNEGKSGLCVSLARVLARSGRRVIVVDCDWRRPRVHRMFNQRNGAGLAELLSGEVAPDGLLYRDEATGAHAIFAGRPKPEHRNLLASDRMRMLLLSLSQDYDLVLIDTPPVLVGADALHLAQMVDKTVFIVRWGYTHRSVALTGMKQMIEVHGKLAGVVLSRVDPRRYKRYGHGQLSYHYARPLARA